MKEGAGYQDLGRLFRPASIAIIGASEDLSRIGSLALHYLLRHGYKGRIYPVNPKYKEVMGFPCYPAVTDIPGPVDLALIGIPRPLVPDALRQLAAKKAPLAILFSAGYAEMGAEGKKEQEAVKELARNSGIRIVGPNCIGIINVHDRIAASFVSGLEMERITPGGIALVAQSGGIGNTILTRANDRSIGLSYFVSSGNELDLEAADFLEYFLSDARTQVIAFLLEDLKDPRKFSMWAGKAREAGKPIVVLKVGRSERGRQAASSHTGAMTGADSFYEALFKQRGICRVADIDELFEVGSLFVTYGRAGGNQAAILSTSGGSGALLADLAADHGIDLPLPSPQTPMRLKDWAPAVSAITNPMDITTQFMNDPEAMSQYLQAFADDPNYDFLILMLTFSSSNKSRSMAESIAAVGSSLKKPLVVCWPVGHMADPAFRILQEAGVPLFFHPGKCLSALGHFVRYAEGEKRRKLL
jgi:acetate---CoA ligase (ADP-forming)